MGLTRYFTLFSVARARVTRFGMRHDPSELCFSSDARVVVHSSSLGVQGFGKRRGCKQIFSEVHSILATPTRRQTDQRRHQNTRSSQSAQAAKMAAEPINP